MMDRQDTTLGMTHPRRRSERPLEGRNHLGRWTLFLTLITFVGGLLFVGAPDAAGRTVSPSHPGFGSSTVLAPSRNVAAPGVAGAVRNLDTGEVFPSIQAAVDDVDTLDGHTLQVEVADLPTPQTTMTKSVTLQGGTGSEVVRMTVDTGSSGDSRGWFLVPAGVDLTVRDLIFDGDGRRIWQAFRHRGSGSFEDCAFRDIQFDSSGPAYQGTAIAIFGATPVDVRRCTFEQIGRIGVLYFGAGVSGSTYEDNVYTGKGDGDFLDYGLELGAGAVVTAQGNRSSDCRGVASSDGSDSAAMLITTFFGPGTTGTYVGNTLTDSTVGLAAGRRADDTSTVTARCNRIVRNGVGLDTDPFDTMNPALTTIDAENNWWGCNAGPNAPGCDLVQDGTPDTDPWLILQISVMPDTIQAGDTADVEASLRENSDGVDVSAICTVPDGIPMDFDTDLGTVNPPTDTTTDGIGMTELQIPVVANDGTGSVRVTVDGETVSAPFDVEGSSVIAIPTVGDVGLGLLALLLVGCGLFAVRRVG